jgi:fatty-acyl-CoA synthase
LVATPEQPEDRQLTIRVAIGNGLRPDVWLPFKRRFGVARIGEFYAATEGATALFNVGDVDHSIGYLSPLANLIFPTAIVRYDQVKEEIVRGADGRCVRCLPGEVGELVAVVKKQFGVSNYSGYTNQAESDKKLLRNAFSDNDTWFRSGDLLRVDEHNNTFFVDRIGDTFRWKGENCATSEVAQVMGLFPGVPEANVYGVTVPGADGRAGMAAISADPNKVISLCLCVLSSLF